MMNLSKIDAHSVVIALVSASIILIGVFVVGNHVTSRVIDHVTATVYGTRYVPEHTDVHVYTRTDPKTGRTWSETSVDHDPPEWHVMWSYQELTYDEETDSNYDNWKVGDKRQMVIREGGWAKNHYLWEE